MIQMVKWLRKRGRVEREGFQLFLINYVSDWSPAHSQSLSSAVKMSVSFQGENSEAIKHRNTPDRHTQHSQQWEQASFSHCISNSARGLQITPVSLSTGQSPQFEGRYHENAENKKKKKHWSVARQWMQLSTVRWIHSLSNLYSLAIL